MLRSTGTMRSTGDSIFCEIDDGRIIEPIPATQVAEQVLRSTTGRYFAFGVIGAGSGKGANDRIRADFAAKALKARDLRPGGRAQGFLFFANALPLFRGGA